MNNQERKISVTYLGGAWPTNIGNAFIDLGSMHSLRTANPNVSINFASELPSWLLYQAGEDFHNTFNLARFMNSEYIVISGMALCDEFITLYGPTISHLKKMNTKFIINGGGGANYSEKEVSNFRDFLKENPPYAFISRDERSFEYYSDLAEHAYNGIDCGFFVSDYFSFTKLDLPEFVIFNFDVTRFNKIVHSIRNRSFFKNKKIRVPEITDKMIINTHHSMWNIPGEHLRSPNTFISDIPEDYMNLYANTQATYSDRVHACIVTLAFNKPAMLFSQTPRAYLFERIGAENIKEQLIYPDYARIKEEKTKQLEFLRKILL